MSDNYDDGNYSKRHFPAKEKTDLFGQASPNICHVYLFTMNQEVSTLAFVAGRRKGAGLRKYCDSPRAIFQCITRSSFPFTARLLDLMSLNLSTFLVSKLCLSCSATIIIIIIHSKYFPVSDWLKPHA